MAITNRPIAPRTNKASEDGSGTARVAPLNPMKAISVVPAAFPLSKVSTMLLIGWLVPVERMFSKRSGLPELTLR
jgi:hypothetical protein